MKDGRENEGWFTINLTDDVYLNSIGGDVVWINFQGQIDAQKRDKLSVRGVFNGVVDGTLDMKAEIVEKDEDSSVTKE